MTAIDLSQFTGNENVYRVSPITRGVITDGVKYLADTAEAYWLVQDILIYQLEPKIRKEPFQVWKLTKNKSGDGAKLTCEDGDYNKVFSTAIRYTDFPLPEITLWFENNTLMLPSER
jgi:hypothetical protein